MVPSCGMWCIQGTVTIKTENGTISPQFATFYLHPEVNAGTQKGTEDIARGLLNPTNDPNVTPNVSAMLVTVEALNEWTEEEVRALDPSFRSDKRLPPGECWYCGNPKKNPYGLCTHCGRFGKSDR